MNGILIILEDVNAKLISIDLELLELFHYLHLMVRVLHDFIDYRVVKALPQVLLGLPWAQLLTGHEIVLSIKILIVELQEVDANVLNILRGHAILTVEELDNLLR